MRRQTWGRDYIQNRKEKHNCLASSWKLTPAARQWHKGHKPPRVIPWVIALYSCIESRVGVGSHQWVQVPATQSVNTAFTGHCTEVPSALWMETVFIVLWLTEERRQVFYWVRQTGWSTSCLTFIRGAVSTHVWEKGLYRKEAILNSQPLFTCCRYPPIMYR